MGNSRPSRPDRFSIPSQIPADLRHLTCSDLQQVADELRAETISAVAVTGGHLGASLGVVELTVALHYVFDTPNDKLIWDVGHQAYPHKILTGRRDRIRTLRTGGGLSGFTKRSESEYDCFGAAIRRPRFRPVWAWRWPVTSRATSHNVVCVIGDGAISAGMAYEAMNNAGAMNRRLIVILNDNEMSIAPPVGAMSNYLSRLLSSPTFMSLRDIGKQFANRLPKFIKDKAAHAEELARGFVTGGTLFEELGFYYVGIVDGHDLNQLVPILENVRDADNGPILVHVRTQKGKGYAPAEASQDKYHGVVKFDVATGKQQKAASNAPSYTKVFGEALVKQAQKDDRIVAITAAMPSGTGVDIFAKAFPDRAFDVGIAEQHGVTFAAGLATQGYKPFVAIYSTFLQRAYDQVVHDVAIQQLPVRFCMDRAGLVGADGPTHAGSFDLAYLGCLPGFVIMAAADEAELVHMVATMADDQRPAVGAALSARRRRRRRDAAGRRAARNRPRPRHQPRLYGRATVARHAARRMHQGGGNAFGARHFNDGRRCALCQAARRESDPAARAPARTAHHHRGGRHRRVRRACDAAACRAGRARAARFQDAQHDAARRIPRPRLAAGDVRQGRARCQRHRRQGVRCLRHRVTFANCSRPISPCSPNGRSNAGRRRARLNGGG